MGYFIGANGIYHEGDAQPGDTEVPQRPSSQHVWLNEAWTYAPIERDYVMAVQVLLDETVQQRNYDNIATAASYAGDPDPIFNAEGTACKAWRSLVWRKCYTDLAAVQAGQMPQPTVEQFVASLPALVWPV